ncbi:3-carboxy-cis,cis-muconate cycloisomerase [Acidiphilium iwatense]|uniref:3-carboxy-cis,cis-muconate cycloisomerase n=1 Tax=Acidiphilium iwatense TaxID=768198 RepID=A0ABS9DZA0_9PROT|nr:3-carboxy-cis,cis-muconate cycloisomerase [Acidiphilium iwatense]MCF3948082.1 3-carboxy-cis,cis-muconate cycloisomerase [Acidiphilium iwatense]
MSLSLPETMASTPAMRAIFDARGAAQAMLDVEAALARANAAIGAISTAAAAAIAKACDATTIDLDALARDGASAGTVVIPLVAWLRAQVPDHADAVHRGGTSQDVVDTALVLQLRRGLELLDADIAAMADAAARLTRDHAATPMIARTLLQPALPTTFGLKAANWLVALDDARLALRDAQHPALTLQFGTAAGTLDGFGTNAQHATETLAAALDLPVPPLPWHTRRAPLARLGCTIAAAIGGFGKIATDSLLLMQAEIAEVHEPVTPGRGGSSAMAHKRNPTLSIAVRAASLRAPHLAATLLAAIPQEHERAAGAWQAEQSVWPDLMLTASGAFAALREALDGLTVDADAMARNLRHAPAIPASAAIPALIAQALDHHDTITKALHP